MENVTNFNLDAVIQAVDSVGKTCQAGSTEEEALRIAAISLLYVRHLKKVDDFRRYYAEFFDPSFQVKVAHSFATKGEADAWLASGKAIDGERVSIAGQGFLVVQLPKGLKFLRNPLPEELGPPNPESP
ncbi:hypothetical protein KYC5002_37315 [Archangium violaceum]|uniref:hypothetical protein n=1 Tax=Archangium violaceum TaxID=83451 RepID=UPI002B31150F|nr:hypothetical protein KYC5002_37315 [Archangium gephyra]